jgi:hypothetical protein
MLQVVSVSEVGVDIDIGPGCLAQVHREIDVTGRAFTQLSKCHRRFTGTDYLPCLTTMCKNPYTGATTGKSTHASL